MRVSSSRSKRWYPVWAEIDLNRLRANLRVIRASVGGSKTQVLAVVKADAYGHGMKEVARALYGAGVRFFGVANLEEAVVLRRVCPGARILVLGVFHPSQIELFFRHRIRPTVVCEEDLAVLERAGIRAGGRRLPVHVKIDTGMGRLGVWHENAALFFKKLAASKAVRLEGIYTHFANADHRETFRTKLQGRVFDRAVRLARAIGLRPEFVHAANSMGLARFRGAHLNLVRPGILLYGINPLSDPGLRLPRALAAIRPVLSWKARVTLVKAVDRGRPLSYGSTHVTRRPTHIATLPVGYGHGYRVAFSDCAPVLVHGRIRQVAGRVTMDQTLLDLGPRSRVRRWETVTLIGEEGPRRITAAGLAALAHTIPYEIVCAIHPKVPRVYRGS